MSYFGKEFKLEKQENFEEFLSAVASDLPADYKKTLVSHKPTLKLVKNGDSYTMYSSKPDGSINETTFKAGEEFEDATGSEKVKCTMTINGNVFTQVQKHTKGELTIKREFSDNAVVVTLSTPAFSGEVKRYYKA